MGKRVMFETVVLVWKCLNGTAPGYLFELPVPVDSASGRYYLGSASMSLLQVPRALGPDFRNFIRFHKSFVSQRDTTS